MSGGWNLETGCWLWRPHWFWSQLRDADGQVTFPKRTETRRDQNAVFRHRRRKIFSNNCAQGYCKLLTTLTVCSYIQQSFTVTSTSSWLPEVPTTTAAFYVTAVTPLPVCSATGDGALSKFCRSETTPPAHQPGGGSPPL